MHRAAGLVTALVVLLVGTLAACGGGSGTADTATLQIVTTVAPLTSIVSSVAGDDPDIEVVGLVPEGTNSHTFEPRPSAAQTLAEADVVFLNGLGLEIPTQELAEANVGDGVEIVQLGDEILPADEWIFDFSFPADGGSPNPHTWTNPPMAKAYAEVVRDRLTALDPERASTYQDNYDTFAAQVDALDEALVRATRTVEEADRKLLTYHDAYAYFADQYGWTVVGAIQPSTFDEPSSKDVALLIEQVRQLEVPAIFGSEVFPSPVLEQIAAETDAVYVDDLRDDDLPGAPGSTNHSWAGLMRTNYVTLIEAFGGDASALRSLEIGDPSPPSAVYPQ